MLGVYFSGTGNTKHCVEKLTTLLDKTAAVLPLESSSIIEQIKNNDTVIFGYPIQFSNAPYMVRDFIKKNRGIWNGKKISLRCHNGRVQRRRRGLHCAAFQKIWRRDFGRSSS